LSDAGLAQAAASLNPLNSLLEALAAFLNLQSRNDFALMVAWLLQLSVSAALILCWRYQASRGQQKPFSRSCSGR
jgi:hypothetical protein